MGSNALFPEGPFAVAAALKAPVIFVFAFKESRFRYHFFGSPPQRISDSEGKADYVKRMCDGFVTDLEQKVKTYADKMIGFIWLSFFILMLLIGISIGRTGEANYYKLIGPVFLAMYGVPTFLCGILLRFRPLLFGESAAGYYLHCLTLFLMIIICCLYPQL